MWNALLGGCVCIVYIMRQTDAAWQIQMKYPNGISCSAGYDKHAVFLYLCVCVCKRGTCGTAHCTLHSDLCQSKKRQQTNVRCTLWWRGHTTHCTAQADIITNFFKCVYVLFAFREQPIFTSNKRWMHLGYHLYSFGNNGQKVNTKKNY